MEPKYLFFDLVLFAHVVLGSQLPPINITRIIAMVNLTSSQEIAKKLPLILLNDTEDRLSSFFIPKLKASNYFHYSWDDFSKDIVTKYNCQKKKWKCQQRCNRESCKFGICLNDRCRCTWCNAGFSRMSYIQVNQKLVVKASCLQWKCQMNCWHNGCNRGQCTQGTCLCHCWKAAAYSL